jgi:hypothetical protein
MSFSKSSTKTAYGGFQWFIFIFQGSAPVLLLVAIYRQIIGWRFHPQFLTGLILRCERGSSVTWLHWGCCVMF